MRNLKLHLFRKSAEVDPPKFEELNPRRIQPTYLNSGVILISVGAVLACGFHWGWAWYVFTAPGSGLVTAWLLMRFFRHD